MAKISPSHVQQHALLSPLSHNFKSITNFFPCYETCRINVNSLFHAAIKKTIIKTFRYLETSLLYIPYKLTEETAQRKHTHARYSFSSLKIITITNITIAKNLSLLCFKRSFVIYLCCQIIYSVTETNHI